MTETPESYSGRCSGHAKQINSISGANVANTIQGVNQAGFRLRKPVNGNGALFRLQTFRIVICPVCNF